MIFSIEIEDAMVDALRREKDSIRYARAQAALLAAVDHEIEDLRRAVQDHVLGNVKEPA